MFFLSCGSTIINSKKLKLEEAKVDKSQIDEKLQKKFDLKEKPLKPEKSEKAEIESNEVKPVKSVETKKEKTLPSKKIEKKEIVISKPQVEKPSVSGFDQFFIGDRVDKKSYSLWKQFSPDYLIEGEEIDIGVTYMGMNAASVKLKVSKAKSSIAGKKAHLFSAIARTNSIYRWVYELDDYVKSYVAVKDFVPYKYSLVQRESKKDIDHIELYDREKLMTYFRYKRVKSNGKVNYRKKDSKIPFFSQDFLSVFYFLRGLPLEMNTPYIIPITTKGKNWNMRIKTVKKENLSIGDFKDIPSFKLEVITEYSGDLAKKGKLFFWISDDKYRRLMKVQAEVKIGSVYGEILKYRIDGREVLK